MNSFYVSKMTKRERIKHFLALSVIILTLGLLYYVIVKLGYGLFCPFYALFGIECPFCGLTRMCVALIELRFIEAFFYNQVAYILLPIICWIYFKTGLRYIKTGIFTSTDFENKFISLMFILMFVFGIYRNFV